MNILPFVTSKGFPQKQIFKLDNVSYSVFYQYNHTANIYTVSIRRISDDVQLYLGKLVEGFYNDIKDNISKDILFTLYVRDLNKMEIWVI